MNIPSALAMIIAMFPDPAKQGQALGLFTAAVAIGNGQSGVAPNWNVTEYYILLNLVTGLFIGAALAAYASWIWIFYLVTILGIAMVAGVLLVMPLRVSTTNPEFEGLSHREKFKRLDLPGVGTLTGMLLFCGLNHDVSIFCRSLAGVAGLCRDHWFNRRLGQSQGHCAACALLRASCSILPMGGSNPGIHRCSVKCFLTHW